MPHPPAFFLSHTGEWWDVGLIIFAVIAGISTLAGAVFTGGSILAHKRESVASEPSLQAYKINWDLGLTTCAVVAGVATMAVGVFTAGSIFAHNREAAAAETSLQFYKLNVAAKVAEARTSGVQAGRKAGEASGIAETAKADVARAQVQVARANASAAEATARAETARLALLKFAAPRQLDTVMSARLKEAVSLFPGTPFAVSIQTSGEALDFERQLVDVLRQSGWRQEGVQAATVYTVPGQPPLGLVSLTGISIYVDQRRADLFEPLAVLRAALVKQGFTVDARRIIDDSEDVKNAIHIYIGEKPRSES